MRAVLQRVSSASVRIEGVETARIGRGLLILLGVQQGDTPDDVAWLAPKIAQLRIFEDAAGKMNLSLLDDARQPPGTAATPLASPACAWEIPDERPADVLVVSQFTLLASTRKGHRPSFNEAARPEVAVPLYESFVQSLERLLTRKILTGTFGAMMQVALVNDGPVTLIVDSRQRE